MINDLCNNVLSSIPQTRREQPRNQAPAITSDLSVAEEGRVYRCTYMSNDKKNRLFTLLFYLFYQKSKILKSYHL